MPIIKFPSINDEPTLDDVVDYIERMRKELQWAMDKNLDTKNAREFSGWLIRPDQIVSKDGDVGLSTADIGDDPIRIFAGPDGLGGYNFMVPQSGFITAVGALIRSVASGYPRLELNGPDSLFAAYKSETELISILPSYTGSPTLRFISPNAEGFISAQDSLGYVWFNATSGHMYLQAQNGNVNVLADTDIFLDPTTGKVKLAHWTKIMSILTGQSMQDVIDALESQIDSKQDRVTSGDVVIIDGEANLSETGITPGTWPKATFNSEGRATAGFNLTASDIPNISESQVTGLATDLAGKASKTIPPWIAPTLLNSWVNTDTGTNSTAGYYKDDMSRVYLKGLLKDGSTTAFNTIFNLPAGYRPAQNKQFIVGCSTGVAKVIITSGGDVLFQVGSNSEFSLDGISFRAEQ